MSKISTAFLNGKALMAYITCGDPDLGTTTEIVKSAVHNGANIIGLGIPFSDPTAEGPVIQESNIRALAKGITTDDIFAYVKELRKEVNEPIIFMTYANVVFSYGADRFFANCNECQVDGTLIADLPYEEREDFLPVCEKYGIELVSALAFNSADRVKTVAKDAKELIYILSSSEEEMNQKAEQVVKDIREVTDVPCVISYGIASTDSVKRMSALGDGVVASEDIMLLLAEHGNNAATKIGELIADIKNNQNK